MDPGRDEHRLREDEAGDGRTPREAGHGRDGAEEAVVAEDRSGRAEDR